MDERKWRVAVAVLWFLSVVVFAAQSRYSLAMAGEGKTAYRLDRWTGSVAWVVRDKALPVQESR